MDNSEQIQSEPAQPAPAPMAAAPAPAETTQPALLGVPAPEGYTGPWPKPGMDGGDPSSWLEQQ